MQGTELGKKREKNSRRERESTVLAGVILLGVSLGESGKKLEAEEGVIKVRAQKILLHARLVTVPAVYY